MTLQLLTDLQIAGKFTFLPTTSEGQFAVITQDGSGVSKVLPQGTFNVVALLRAAEDATGQVHVWLELLPTYEETSFEIDKAIADQAAFPYKRQPTPQTGHQPH